jgi:hypothetical protein
LISFGAAVALEPESPTKAKVKAAKSAAARPGATSDRAERQRLCIALSSQSSFGFHYWLAGLASAITLSNTSLRRWFVGRYPNKSSLAADRSP